MPLGSQTPKVVSHLTCNMERSEQWVVLNFLARHSWPFCIAPTPEPWTSLVATKGNTCQVSSSPDILAFRGRDTQQSAAGRCLAAARKGLTHAPSLQLTRRPLQLHRCWEEARVPVGQSW